ncbi:MAG: 4-hydroxythreonine-4-phosphate dehydrogenase PdxA [Candidatus Bathyarchaeota archaeon]|nr:4-hydroxythreonine-4-phosphate dehydrogenase PdxA [Candidatus Bathyarchaeota archaeon]
MRPIIGVTMGDAAGVGPEIIAKTLSLEDIYRICRPVVIGDARAMQQAEKIAQVNVGMNPLSQMKDAKFEYGVIDVLDLKNINFAKLKMGKVSAMTGRAAVEYVEKAVELALNNEIHAITTAPINKEAIKEAGYDYAGHTELLADLTNSRDYAMMLVKEPLRVTHVTTHSSLWQACEMIRKERICKVIELTREALQAIGIEQPRIAVASLNPHRGEGGLFGKEEIEEIAPAVEAAKQDGVDVEGPLPADTVFVKARGGAYDAVVAMYHDQGHIPIKLLGLEWNEKKRRWTMVSGVNITIGLPIIRTSVDHGTAFGKAGKGTANPDSMTEAIKLAAAMAEKKLSQAQNQPKRPSRSEAVNGRQHSQNQKVPDQCRVGRKKEQKAEKASR